jgi:WD40 repeat protein
MGWSVESLAFAPNGRWLAAGKLDRSLLILDVETGSTSSRHEQLNELGQVVGVAFSPDGRYVIAVGDNGTTMRWSIDATGALSGGRTLSRRGSRVESLAVSPSIPFLATGTSDGSLFWQSYVDDTDRSQGQKFLTRGALAIHFAQNGREAMATDGLDLVRVDLENARQIEIKPLKRCSPRAAAFSGDGNRLAVSSSYEIEVWDTTTAASLLTLQADHEIQWSIAFLPGASRLVSGGRGQVTLWNLDDGSTVTRFDFASVGYIQNLAISPDGALLAAIPASAGQTLTVFRIPE